MRRQKVKYKGRGWVVVDAYSRPANACDLAKLLPLLAAIGVPWVHARQGHEDWFGWNGTTMRLNEDASDLFHEVGHWLCASPGSRHLPDFGIAEDSEPYIPHGPALWPDDEEAMASLLGILMERALGQPWADTFCFHSWRNRDHGGGITQTLDMLRAAGLIRDMTPTCIRPLTQLPATAFREATP